MGIGRASGDGRAQAAVKQAINSPLLDTTIEGARGVILNFTGGRNMRLQEIDQAASVVRDEVSDEADIIVGAVVDSSLEDEIMITIIASGFDNTVNASAGHRASTSVLSRNNPNLISDAKPAPAPSAPVNQTQAPISSRPQIQEQPVSSRPAPGFLFGDDSVNNPVRTQAPITAPVEEPVPAPEPVVPQTSYQPQQVPPYQQPVAQPAPQPVQQGGRPQVNVAPEQGEKPARSAKPWFMFGRDSE